MNIIVLIKQVPDTTEVRIDPKTNTLIREGVESIMNPYDQYALEEAVRLRDSIEGSSLTVISMGPPQARKVLLKGLALGADRAILLSDRAFAGSDTWATSVALSGAISAIGDYDMIFCGLQAIDGDTAQVGPETAELLDIPQVTYAEKLERGTDGSVIVHQQMEDGRRMVSLKTPFLVTCIPPPSYRPRVAAFKGILGSLKKPYDVWDAKRIGIDTGRLGLAGSPTQVSRTYSPEPRGEVRMFRGDTATLAARLVRELIGRGVVGGGGS
ncbi:electron transfer flavoprotein subunit beta [Thermoplasmatales archaeon ex4484_6]|nr:MAG: electron transfer flavoprotein subunit beta [Thermoplasmatales archaeon ex4484_6]RLF68806.1 MAG: electron transfer flavoprotein subunit beta [Thermoplasmata archaeon]